MTQFSQHQRQQQSVVVMRGQNVNVEMCENVETCVNAQLYLTVIRNEYTETEIA